MASADGNSRSTPQKLRGPGQEPAHPHEKLHRAALRREHVHERHLIGRVGEQAPTGLPDIPCSLLVLQDYRDLLRAQMGEAFPDLADALAATAPHAIAASARSAANGAHPSTSLSDLAVGPSGLDSNVKMEDAR